MTPRRKTLAALCFSLIGSPVAGAPPVPEPATGTASVLPADRTRLAEASRLARVLSDEVWSGWSRAPFAVLLVTPDRELLIGHPAPPEDFTVLGADPVLKAPVSSRPRTLPKDFLATFPVGGVSTVVVGQAEATQARTSTPWVVSLLHEHFHQLQDSQPDFYAKVGRLGLSRGDTTGMWMLDFPFPYESPGVGAAFSKAARALADALEAPVERLPEGWSAYVEARRQLRQGLAPDDRSYLDFQIWKEGVARYTEIRMAELAAKKFRPSDAYRALPDFTPFVSARRRVDLAKELHEANLASERRIVFYAFGAGEAFLLDRVRPCWREGYFREMFTIDAAFAPTSPCDNVRSIEHP